MKAILISLVAAIVCMGCNKAADAILEKSTSGNTTAGQFTKYIIQQGKQYCEGNMYKQVDLSELKFVVKFDSTAIYQTKSAENQYDINKLYGFSDNNLDHHQYSARFGWRWSANALRLFAYVYNAGSVISKELTSIAIGSEFNCAIKVTPTNYLFTVNGITTQLPRMAATDKAKGYQLYPYFGGDEAAPHQINIWIKNIN